MQRLEVSAAVRLLYGSLGVKGLRQWWEKYIYGPTMEGTGRSELY